MSEHLGETIRRARQQAGLSLADLAKRVYVTKGYLSRIENGKRRPTPSVLRAVTDALHIGIAIAECETYPWDAPASDGVALVLEPEPDGSVVVVPMDRRAFLATATASAALVAVPVAVPARVTADVVTALRDRMEWHVVAGRTATPATMSRLLRSDLDGIVQVTRDAPTNLRPALLSLGARYAEYLGWMRQDAGDADGAMTWTNHAADLAYAAGWRHMVSYTMTRKSLIALQGGDADHAADLARVARSGTWRTTPGLSVLAATQEAEAHACRGRSDDARRALDVARRYVERVDPGDEPPIGPRARSIDQLLATRTARCELSLGRPGHAVEHLTPVVPAASFRRWRATEGALLALAYARVDDVDRACSVAWDAAQNGAGCESATTARELRALRPALAPWAGRSDVDQVLAALPA